MTETVEDIALDIEDLKSRIKKVNAESKYHRLNTESAKEEAEDYRRRVEELGVTRNKLEADHKLEVESLLIAHKDKLTATQKERDEAKTSAQKRIVDADLKLAARDAGMVDLDGLKLLDREGVKLDDDGNVVNAAELLTAMKEAKPYLFGAVTPPGTQTGNTSSTSKKPGADGTGKKINALDLSTEEYDAALRALSREGR